VPGWARTPIAACGEARTGLGDAFGRRLVTRRELGKDRDDRSPAAGNDNLGLVQLVGRTSGHGSRGGRPEDSTSEAPVSVPETGADLAGRQADPWCASVLDAIGDTPLIRVDEIWVKLEFLNPSGSIKARIAKYLIERAEAEGLLQAGDTIVEASSGNTGNAMAMVAAVKGYRMLVVMPDGLSQERAAISRAYGAQVMTLGDFQVTDALAKVRELGEQPGYFAPQQFDSEWNVEENRTWLGPEVLAQLPAGVVPDAVVGGVGTGGTIVGVGQAFRAVNPRCRVVAVEPNESCTLMCGEVGRHLIEGIADGFVPGIIARYRDDIDALVAVDSEQAILEMRRLAQEFGLFVGPSSGAHLIAARELKQSDDSVEHVVTFFCDEGEKYLNDYFLS
jgi:cysteine synthase A